MCVCVYYSSVWKSCEVAVFLVNGGARGLIGKVLDYNVFDETTCLFNLGWMLFGDSISHLKC